MPTLLIDSLSTLGQASGVGRYCRDVTSRLPGDLFEKFYYYGYVTRKQHPSSGTSALDRLKCASVRLRPLKTIARKSLRLVSPRRRWDLYWQPNFIPLDAIRAKRVVATVHDFAWERYPQFQPRERVAHLQKHFHPAMDSSDCIITVSQFVRDELLQRLPHLADRVKVIHNGFDGSVYYPAPAERRLGKYILCVGSIEPRKNVLNLLSAYALVDPAIRREYPLLLVGAFGWRNTEILAKVAELKGAVRYLGYVSDRELADYYRGALCLVYPSLYEGFGLPPLEAMACGTPVIVSKVSSLPEVCGTAARYVDPANVDEIRDAIHAFAYDEQLRETFAQLGLVRAAHFSWERSAAAHAELFRAMVGE